MADSTEQDDPKDFVDADTAEVGEAPASDAPVIDTVEVIETVDVIVEDGTVEIVDIVETVVMDDGDVVDVYGEPAASSEDLAGAVDAGDETPVIDAAFIDAPMEAVDEADLRRPIDELKGIVEAMVFASPEPLTPKALLKLLDTEPREDVLEALEALQADYAQRTGGLQLVEVAGGFQIVTRHDLHEWVRRLFHERSTQKLSVQALESLAVIAYRQPITALEITEIRGVSASGVLNTLLERHLIKIVGRKQVVGRPFMYATTKEFLIRFGLKDLSDLPRVEDMAESLGIESSLLVEREMPEEQMPLSEPDTEPSGYDAAEPADSGVDDENETDDPEPSVH